MMALVQYLTIFFKCQLHCLQKSGKYYLNDLFIYLYKVPGADTAAIAAISAAALTNGGRLCGRVLASATGILTNGASIAAGTVCGKSEMYGSSNPVF